MQKSGTPENLTLTRRIFYSHPVKMIGQHGKTLHKIYTPHIKIASFLDKYSPFKLKFVPLINDLESFI